MCNNIVALGNSTKSGRVLFGKNSDRAPNEAHVLETVPAITYPKSATVRCSHLEIPQVGRTNALLLARPCWTWGAEMGANEHGLTIGNTAVYTKVPYQTGPGLLGMDLVRLALERASNGREAVEVITELLELYGQGGNCGFRKKFYYHNSFLIADPSTAWIVETAGRHWIAREVRDVGATSNTLTITTEFDQISRDTIAYAVEQGWHKAGRPFNFKKSYGGAGLYPSYLWTLLGKGDERQCRLLELLEKNKGALDERLFMTLLRDHGEDEGARYDPAKGYFSNAVCMHAGFGPVRSDQTTGSMISHLTEEAPTHWLTGSSAPCTSIFKPVWLESGLPHTGVSPTGQFCLDSLWWCHEQLHRETLRDYPARLGVYKNRRDSLENDFLEEARRSRELPLQKRLQFSRDCFQQASEATEQWLQAVQQTDPGNGNSTLYNYAWGKRNEEAFLYFGTEEGHTSVP